MAKGWKADGLTTHTRVDEAAPVVIQLKLAELRHHAVLAQPRTDPEDLHATRVASRRLRAALDLMGGPLGELVDGVRRLGHALGRLRDQDVTLEWLEASLDGARPDERVGIEHLAAEWRRGLGPLEVLAREALAAFEAHVGQALTLRIEEAGWPAPCGGKRLRRRLARGLERLDERLAHLLEVGVSDVAAVHAVRIAGKKARYMMELVEDVFPALVGEALDRLKRLQSLLGEVHDADVRIGFLPRLLVGAETGDQPGITRLLRLAYESRDEGATALADELRSWEEHAAGRLAQRFLDEKA